MSDGFKQSDVEMKDLKNCPKCNTDTRQDIFIIDYTRKKKRNEPGFAECRACFDCKIIYEIIS